MMQYYSVIATMRLRECYDIVKIIFYRFVVYLLFTMDNCKTLTLLFLALLCIISCKQKKNEQPDASSDKLIVDTALISIIPYDTVSMRWMPNCKPAELTATDVDMIDLLMDGYLKVYNKTQEDKYNFYAGISPSDDLDKYNFVIDMHRYKRQYIAMINDKEEKVVWINCFCQVPEDFDWHKNIVRADDGGNCYFNLLINLTTRKCSDLMVNGNT